MRCRLEYNHPRRLLTAYIHGAPHRRIHRRILEQYRVELWRAAQEAGLEPIKHNISLSAYFIEPNRPGPGQPNHGTVPGTRRQDWQGSDAFEG